MEISAVKKLMTSSTGGIKREIKFRGQELGTVTSFKYLGEILSDESSKPDVLSMTAYVIAKNIFHLRIVCEKTSRHIMA